MRNFELETCFDPTPSDLLADRVACKTGGIPPFQQRGGSAFDGTGHSPSGPGNANIADRPRGRKGTGAVIQQLLPGQPAAQAKGEKHISGRKAESVSQAHVGATEVTKPRTSSGGRRPV